MPAWFPLLGALALCTSACGESSSTVPPSAQRAGRPNVLWITIDTLRARDLEAYGYDAPTSPHLRELAENGALIEHAFAQAPWTKPSVASMFTSVRPHSHQAVSESTRTRLAEPLVTLAEVLQQNGYQTGGFSENPHIQRATGFDQGFDEFVAQTDWGNDAATEETVDAAHGWIAERDPRRPFFCYVQVLDPHAPYRTSGFQDLFVDGPAPSDPDLKSGNVDAFQKKGAMVKPLEGEQLTHMKQLYDAEIRAVDEALGGLFDALTAAGILDETLIVITSDHGEEFAEHGGFLHGYHVFDEAIHIPVLLHGPGIAARRIDDVLVEHVDLAPTLVELVGLPVPTAWPKTWVGTSFAKALGDAPFEPSPELTEIVSESTFRERNIRALRTRDWKLVHDLRGGTHHLYDLRNDPEEREDVLAEHPEVAASLNARLEQILAEAPSVDPDATQGEGDAALESMLSEIGYLDGDTE